MILVRDAERWFKPPKNQFQIFYRRGPAHLQYVPDFVAETGIELLMIEMKARNEMTTPEVVTKGKAAGEWCLHGPLMRPHMAASLGVTFCCPMMSSLKTERWRG